MTNIVNLPTYEQVEGVKESVESLEIVIHENGGTNLNSRTFLTNQEPSTDLLTVRVDVTGKGILNSLTNNTNQNAVGLLRIDDGKIIGYQVAAYSTATLMLGFNNHLEFGTNINNFFATYTLE